MSDPAKSEKKSGAAWPLLPADVAEMVSAQMQSLADQQSEFLDESQKLMAAWTKRGQMALEDGFRTFAAACACKDAIAIQTLYGEWLRSSAERFLADMNETRNEALHFAEIGQKFVATAFPRGVDAAAATPSLFDITKTEGKRAKETPRSEAPRQAAPRAIAEPGSAAH